MIERAVGSINAGEVVGLPTDTVYGLGVDPLNRAAFAKLYELKGRPDHRPVGLLVASIEQAREIGVFDRVGEDLMKTHWPGPLTLVVAPKVILADWVGDTQTRTVGLRVPDLEVTIELLSETGPLAVTSANLSGGPETMGDAEARALFGDRVAFYVEGKAPGGVSSTVVDLTGFRPVVVREGPVHI
jgi:tRNA threonylcarbamoyl adenosine modification protein (Sua5/YciO/YrdC/YwlC family)